MISREITIHHPLGLHARPASLFVQTALKFPADIEVAFNEKTANGKSLLGIMSLGVTGGCVFKVSAQGSQEDEAVEALAELVSNNFNEN